MIRRTLDAIVRIAAKRSVTLSIGVDASAPLRYGIAGIAFAIVVGAVAYSKSKDIAIGGDDLDSGVRAANTDSDSDPAPAQV